MPVRQLHQMQFMLCQGIEENIKVCHLQSRSFLSMIETSACAVLSLSSTEGQEVSSLLRRGSHAISSSSSKSSQVSTSSTSRMSCTPSLSHCQPGLHGQSLSCTCLHRQTILSPIRLRDSLLISGPQGGLHTAHCWRVGCSAACACLAVTLLLRIILDDCDVLLTAYVAAR